MKLKAIIDRENEKLIAVASSSVEDRHGEIVKVDGWELKNFKKNPIIQWAHDHTIPAIGQAKNLKVSGDGKKAKLTFEPMFHELTDFAKSIKALFEEGILNSFSVGFRPLEAEGNTYLKQELLEISAVNVPANPEARIMAFKSLHEKGYDTDDVVKGLSLEYEKKIFELENKLSNLENEINVAVKGIKFLTPPQGRNENIVNARLKIAKSIDKMAEQLLTATKQGKPANEKLIRAIDKQATALIIHSKEELKINGSN